MYTEKTNYHHGNLRNALIEAGIQIINEQGEQALSLRKIAVACQVSEAAPYSHFKNKDDLIANMQEYVTQKFCRYLQNAIYDAKDASEGILLLGRAYVRFFLENKTYYSFLFHQPCLSICLSSPDKESNFAPFLMLKEAVMKYDAERNIVKSRDDLEYYLIRLWAYVHGIVAVASMDNVTWDKKWSDELDRLIV